MNCLEAMAALIVGKKVRDVDWDEGDYVHFVDGDLIDQDDELSAIDMDQSYKFEEYTGLGSKETQEEEEDGDF